MPSYYTRYTPKLDMSQADYDEYKNNKRLAETYGDADGTYNARNQALRDKYGIVEDTYSYKDLDTMDRVNNIGENVWDREATNRFNRLNKFRDYQDKYADDIEKSYNVLQNFSYNPNEDPSFKAYADMYARQGRAAQDQTYSELSALSGGRNNSWASAATAQVGQAYAQKASDMIPQLAEAAYNKLLNRYNMDIDRSERAYSRELDKYNMDVNMLELAQNRANMYRDIALNQENFEMNRETWLNNLQEQKARLATLPEELQLAVEQGRLNVEQQRILNKYLDRQQDLETTLLELQVARQG